MSATPARSEPVRQDGAATRPLHNTLEPTALPRQPDSIGDRRCGRVLRLGSVALPDAAQYNGDSGHALFDLAVIGRSRDEARTRLTTAVAGHGPAYARSRAIAQTKLASLTMTAGDPVEAATIGNEVLETGGTLRSRPAADDLRELGRYAGRHPKIPEVVELRQRIRKTVVAS
jgi:hypothetical protein